MKKTHWRNTVVTLIIMCIMGMVLIGFLRGLILSKDFTASENVTYLQYLRIHYWGNIHFYLSIAFAALSIIYIILSWSRIKDKGLQLFHRGWAMMIILITVLFFVVFFLLCAFSPIAPDDYEVHEGEIESEVTTDQMTLMEEEKQIKKEQEMKEELRHKELFSKKPGQRPVTGRKAAVPSGILITGRMNLYDLEEITGIPAREIADELGIPSNTSLHENLGRLRKKYLFSMQEVRNAVTSLRKKNRKKDSRKSHGS